MAILKDLTVLGPTVINSTANATELFENGVSLKNKYLQNADVGNGIITLYDGDNAPIDSFNVNTSADTHIYLNTVNAYREENGNRYLIKNFPNYDFGLEVRPSGGGSTSYASVFLSKNLFNSGDIYINAFGVSGSVVFSSQHIKAGSNSWSPTYDADLTTKRYVDNSMAEKASIVIREWTTTYESQ